VARQTLWDLTAVVTECEYNFCDMARILRTGENTFRRPCNFKELRVVKGRTLQLVRYVPDGSLCTASAEQIFPRDSVQRNCFELALYTTRDHDCISDRIGWGIRNIRDADVGSLRSVRSQRRRRYIARSSCRTIIGSGDMLLAPHHHQLRRSHRSIHCWHGHAARRSALPRERFSPMTRSGRQLCRRKPRL